VASLKEATRDGAALFTRGSRNNDCELLRHVLLPFSCGQARGSRRDWNNPEKAGRTSPLRTVGGGNTGAGDL
jgi:hypothetical protein